MMSGWCFKIIWGWGKVGGIVDKIRLALLWPLSMKLGDSWGTWGFFILFFLLLCIFKNFHNKSEEKSGWVNIYCSHSLEKSKLLFIVMWSIFAFVLCVAGFWQKNIITILDYENIDWVWYLSTGGIYLSQSNTQKS